MALKTSYYGGGLQYFRYDEYEIINGKTYSVTNVDMRYLGRYINHNNEKYIEVAGLKEGQSISVDYEVLIFHGATQVGKINDYYYVDYVGNSHLARIDIDERFIPYVNPNGMTTFKTNVRFGDWEPGGSTPYYLDSGIWLTSDSNVDLVSLGELQVNYTNTDEQITITWQNTNNSQMQLWLTNSSGIVYEKHLIDTNTHTIPAKTLVEGTYTISVQPYADYAIRTPISREFGRLGPKSTKSITVIQPTPIILTLEPNNIPQSKDNDILVSWTSKNQQEYELKVKLDGILVKTYTGTTEKYINITKGTLPNTGNVEMTLTIKYMPTWGTLEADKRVATKTATFLAFGKPATPNITSGTTFDTSRPTITWAYDDEQVAFQLTILKDSQVVIDSGVVYGAMTNYKLSHSLENNTSYTIRLKIRNQYNAFSDEAIQTINIAYDILQAPTFFIRSNNENGSILIDITNPTQAHLAYCEIYRKSDNEDWIRIAKDLSQNDSFTDYGLVNNKIYDYKIRAVSDQEGYTDSDVKKCSVTLSHTQLIDATDISKILSLRFSPNKTLNIHRGINTMDYVGRRGISVEYNAKQYTSISCSFTVRDKDKDLFLELFSSGNILLYRDNRNLKLYGHIINEPQVRINNNGWCDISFVFAESDYSEVI